jgi:rubrerythrin
MRPCCVNDFRYRPIVSRLFTDLEERDVLALAISFEEEDSRIYRDYAERMKEKYPETASILQSMSEVELSHHRRLIEVFQGRFGDHVPYFRRQDVKGFIKRKPIWLNIHLKPKRVRQEVMGMEAESRRFYQQGMEQVKSPEVRVLLEELAAVEEEHQDIFVEEVRKKKKSGALEKEEERS